MAFKTTMGVLFVGVLAVLLSVFFFDLIPDKKTSEAASGFKEYVRHKRKKEDLGGPEIFAAYHNAIKTRSGEKYPDYPLNYQVLEFNKALKHNKQLVKLRETLNWVERGPGNVGGRTRGLLVDPNDETFSIWFAGSVGGGVWKTTDAGQSWINLTPGFPTLATSTLAMPTSNPQIIYVGTGEGYANLDNINGNGIWKSTDGGNTWNQLPFTANDERFTNIMRIVVNPENENEVIACTRVSRRLNLEENDIRSYIFRSTNGGQSWVQTYATSATVSQIVADPTDFNTLYGASWGDAVIKSTNGGLTWQKVFNVRDFGLQRMEMAIAPTNAERIYMASYNNSGSKLFFSNDAGENWSEIGPENEDQPFGDWLGDQGWYDNTIAVHPFDENKVFVGGVGPILEMALSDSGQNGFGIASIDNETDFLSLVEIPFFGTGVLFTSEIQLFTGFDPELSQEDYVSVEIRFGGDRSQKAHRNSNTDFGFQDIFLDYIDVPFEVWDITNNRQLMVSFADENNDGSWTPVENTGDLEAFPEMISIHTLDYNSGNPDPEIQANFLFQSMYTVLAGHQPGVEVDQNNLPEGILRINLGGVVTASFRPVTDGYQEYVLNFPEVLSKGVHVDHHNLLMIPVDESTGKFYILNANDGGVAFSDDSGETFSQTGDAFKSEFDLEENEIIYNTFKGYNTAQFYGVDKMNGESRYVGGTQDNGSWVSDADPGNNSEWVSAPSGDGFEAIWHYREPNKVMESSQFNNVYRSNDGGATWEQLSLPGNGPFITRLANSKSDPDVVYACSQQGVLRSVDFGSNWEVIEMPEAWDFDGSFGPPIEVSIASPTVVWTGARMDSLSSLVVSKDGGTSFQVTKNYTQAKLGRVSGISTHPTEPSIAYALFSIPDGPKVLKTEDYGETWTDISGFVTNRQESTNGFPDVSVYSLVVMPYNTNIIWVGTEIGLFESVDGGQSWSYADNGLPAVAIWEMKIVNDEVVLATHGRGIWSVAIPELEGYEPPQGLLLPELAISKFGFNGILDGSFNLRSPYDSSKVKVTIDFGGQLQSIDLEAIPENLSPTLVDFDLVIENIPEDTIVEATLELTSYIGQNILSVKENVYVFQASFDPVSNYSNNLESKPSGFARLDMGVYRASGFNNKGLHSPHPYDGLSTYFSILQQSILIEEETRLNFDEVVLVEPGDSPDFGSPDFFDFVVVEGTVDKGRNWVVLEGYDSRFNRNWQDAFDADANGSQSLMENHEIRLSNFFEIGDTVFLRFRLESDPFVEGWGWVVDNINIQDVVTSVNSGPKTTSLNLSAYPNPTSDFIQFKYSIPEKATVEMEWFDQTGKRVRNVNLGTQLEGVYEYDTNIKGMAPGVYFCKLKAGKTAQVLKWVIL